MSRFDIKQVAEAALQRIDEVLAHWVPDGSYQGAEYVALNPIRADKNKGSFSINRNTGAWCEFAEGKGGADLVSMVAYLDRINNGEACQRLGKWLGMVQPQELKPKLEPYKASGRKKQAAWVPIMPIPEGTEVTCPRHHYSSGEPSKVWEYRDADNRLLMKVMRFDVTKQGERQKDYRPLVFAKSSNKDSAWRWMQPPNNRPLYGLNYLARKPKAVVVLTEGEKAADAATALLPSMVCMSWAGGSKAIGKADFSPLAGREVWLWPDNDKAGLECMAKIEPELIGMGCKVRKFSLQAFGENWPNKADAADAEAQGLSISSVSALIESGALFTNPPPKPDQPLTEGADAIRGSTPSGWPFVLNDRGLFFKGMDGEGEAAMFRVCDRLEVLAKTRDESGRNWGTLVRFSDPDGELKEWNIPSELLATDGGNEVRRQLFSMGLGAECGSQPQRRLIQYIQTAATPKRAILVNRLGWHNEAYLLPSTTLGTPKEPLFFYSITPDLNKVKQSGTLELWRENVAAFCCGNSKLLFSISSAFAAPLLHLIGMETTGFHFFGDSSQGKTTLLKLAASVYGSPDYVRTWRSTDNALESIAAAHSDGLLILDEISQCDPRMVGDIAYMLGNGKGKARANDRGGAKSNAFEWRLLFLSTGEKTLQQHMAEVGKTVKAGQEVRLLAIPSDAGSKLGIFENLHNFAGGAPLSKHLVENAERYYGEPFLRFIESLCASNHERIASRIRAELTSFCADIPTDASGQVRRAAEKFALVGFAGELATKVGITAWRKGEAKQAARSCFDAWVSARGGVGSVEDQQILAQVQLQFERYGEARFTRWDRDDSTVDDHNVRTMERWGFRKTLEDSNVLSDGECKASSASACSEVVYYATSEAFKSEICKGLSLKRVKELLGECGALERDNHGGYTVPTRLPGAGRNPKRVYVVRPHLIPDIDHDNVTKAKAA